MLRVFLNAALASALFFPAIGAHAGVFEDCSSGAPAKAIPACTKVLKNPKLDKLQKTLVLVTRGLSYMASDDLQAAIEDLQKAVALDPKNIMGYRGLTFAF
jgi:tetratricopeptide (TPR) repeat protein